MIKAVINQLLHFIVVLEGNERQLTNPNADDGSEQKSRLIQRHACHLDLTAALAESICCFRDNERIYQRDR